jgi:hypothetical protein
MILKPWIVNHYAEDYIDNAHHEAERATLARSIQGGPSATRWRQPLIRVLDRLSNQLGQVARELGEAEQTQTGRHLSLR